jgi:hypothetical protein
MVIDIYINKELIYFFIACCKPVSIEYFIPQLEGKETKLAV